MESWQDKFTAKLNQVKADINSAQLGYENGYSKEQIEEHLKSARLLLKEASGLCAMI